MRASLVIISATALLMYAGCNSAGEQAPPKLSAEVISTSYIDTNNDGITNSLNIEYKITNGTNRAVETRFYGAATIHYEGDSESRMMVVDDSLKSEEFIIAERRVEIGAKDVQNVEATYAYY